MFICAKWKKQKGPTGLVCGTNGSPGLATLMPLMNTLLADAMQGATA
tara:strand:+ start:571 stop:711 length:141 start_codon:yes stop_codon:yes gene_type:complete